MKSLILLSLLLVPIYSLSANLFYLPDGAVSFSSLENGRIEEVWGKEVVVEFDMSHDCSAKIGPISYELIPSKENGKFVLLLSALKIKTDHNLVFCFLGRYERRTFRLPITVEKDRLELKFMKVQWDNQLERNGTLSFGQIAIGGETTGVVLKTPDGDIELVIPERLEEKAKTLEGHEVRIFGVKTKLWGIERGVRQAIRVRFLEEVGTSTL